MMHLPPHEQIAAERARQGMTLAQFAVAIGCSSKGRVSEMENGKVAPTVAQALAIEKLSSGRITAHALNADVAAAREAIGRGAAQCWALSDAELAALPAPDPVILCIVCERRTDGPSIPSCTELDCPHVTRHGNLAGDSLGLENLPRPARKTASKEAA